MQLRKTYQLELLSMPMRNSATPVLVGEYCIARSVLTNIWYARAENINYNTNNLHVRDILVTLEFYPLSSLGDHIPPQR